MSVHRLRRQEPENDPGGHGDEDEQRAGAIARAITGEVIIPEGTVARGDLSIEGPAVEPSIRRNHFDLAVLGACAAHPDHGLTVAGWADSRNRRAALHAAKRVILPATADKSAMVATNRFGGLANLDVIITDDSTSPALLDRLADLSVEVLVADVPELG